MGRFDSAVRGIALVIFILLFFIIYTDLSVDVWNFSIVSEMFTRYYWIVGYLLGFVLELVMTGYLIGLTRIMSFLGPLFGYTVEINNVFIANVPSFLRAVWRYPTELPPELLQLLGSITSLLGPIQVIVLYLIQPIIYSLFPILMLTVVISIMLYAVTGTPRFGIIAFAALHGMVTVASIQVPELFTRSTQLGFEQVPLTILEFYQTQIFQIALLSYFFLETLYISDYLRQMLDPQSYREKHIFKQLQLIKQQADRPVEKTEDSEVITGSQFTKLYGSDSFTFIREILEKRLFKRKPLEDKLGSMHDVRRLNTYVEQLQRKNTSALDTLTARSALPNKTQILSPTILGTTLRAIVLIIIAYFVIQPATILNALNVPPPVLESIEASSPEMSLFILLPITSGIALISTIIRYFIERTVESQEQTEKIIAETTSGTQVAMEELKQDVSDSQS